MKIVRNQIFLNSLNINFLSVTQRSFTQYVCIIGFDGVLGGVMGAVFSVVFGVLLTLVNFTSEAIVGMTTFGSN